jgi:alpha-ketoglutarate-dependent taurine dioxygenase
VQHELPKSEWYRTRAADCMLLAEHAPNAGARSVLADMAATWLRLAELADKRELNDGCDKLKQCRGR